MRPAVNFSGDFFQRGTAHSSARRGLQPAYDSDHLHYVVRGPLEEITPIPQCEIRPRNEHDVLVYLDQEEIECGNEPENMFNTVQRQMAQDQEDEETAASAAAIADALFHPENSNFKEHQHLRMKLRNAN